MPIQFDNFVSKPPCIGSDWPPAKDDWKANNNTLGDWDKCFKSTSDIPQHLAATFGNASLAMLTAKQPEKILPDTGYSSPKEDGRKSSEHTNSYDVSASQSPNTDGAQSDSTIDEPIDVEIMTQTEEMDVDGKDDTLKAEIEEAVEIKTPVPTLPAPIAITPIGLTEQRIQTLEEILALPQHRFQEVIAGAENMRKSVPESITSLFMRSGSSAFSNIEPKEASQPPSVSNGTEPPAPTVIVAPNSSLSTSASFCRPPGLGPVSIPPAQNGQTPQLVCPICGFTCPSKFHFNSHMNTHGDHQCSMCDYTSRTEGRLKKHMQQSHTIEEQLRVGLELEPAKEATGSSSSPKSTATSKDSSATSPVSETFNLSTTMASLLDSTNTAIAAISTTDMPSSLPTSLKLDIASTPNLLSTLTGTSITSSALDQIKAFAENSNLLPENGMSLATALGAVSQVIKGEPGSPEKPTNSEPRRSSNGKVKKHKCKQCQHISTTKNDQWSHARTHIPIEKQLNCQQCNFVTEYKHHLEYHYRNHIGSKPFKCVKCGYSCVNKSMLNSHMKSHTNHYQFRCVDCTYATKYCHSLKLHLKKYNHRRVPEGMDMNSGDISPSLSTTESIVPSSPTQIKQEIKTEPSEPSTPIAQPFAFNPMVNGQGLNFANQMMLNNNGLMGINGLRNGVPSFKCPVCDVVCSSQEDQMRHSMSHILSSTTVPTTIASLYNSLNLPHFANVKIENKEEDDEMEVEIKVEDDATDSQHSGEEMDHSSDLASSPTGSSQASSADEDTKKCKSLTMNQFSQSLRGSSPMSNDSAVVKDEESVDETQHSPSDTTSMASPPHNPVVIAAPIPITPQPDTAMLQALLQHATASMAMSLASRNQQFICSHCRLQFPNQSLYTAHLATHIPPFDTQYKCNRCQFSASDSLGLAFHLFHCPTQHH